MKPIGFKKNDTFELLTGHSNRQAVKNLWRITTEIV